MGTDANELHSFSDLERNNHNLKSSSSLRNWSNSFPLVDGKLTHSSYSWGWKYAGCSPGSPWVSRPAWICSSLPNHSTIMMILKTSSCKNHFFTNIPLTKFAPVFLNVLLFRVESAFGQWGPHICGHWNNWFPYSSFPGFLHQLSRRQLDGK